jgi:hypothetical protein
MLVDRFKLKGRVTLLLKDQYGNIKTDTTYDNYITNAGRAYIAYNMHEFSYNTTTVSGAVLTLTAHGFAVGDEIIFTALGGNTGLTTNTLYFITSTNFAANTFSVATTEGGAAITITGAANMTFRHKQNNMTLMAVGTGSTLISDATLTALVAETGVRKTATASRFTTTITNDAIQYVTNFAAGESTGALNEAGIFNAGTSGVTGGGGLMLARTVFGGGSTGVINKGANDTLQITWRITVT